MEDEIRPGYYQDHHGVWQRDRRVNDRRNRLAEHRKGERRANGRRRTDAQIRDRDHREMIREALDEFSAEHDGK